MTVSGHPQMQLIDCVERVLFSFGKAWVPCVIENFSTVSIVIRVTMNFVVQHSAFTGVLNFDRLYSQKYWWELNLVVGP